MFKDYRHEPMKLEGLTNYKDLSLLTCFVDADQIEDGFRSIEILEHTEIIETGVFEEYNSGDIALKIFHILSDSNYYINEWMKRLSRKQIVKLRFPADVDTLQKKAQFMLEKEKKMRLLKVHIPASVYKINVNSFPILLEEITVDEENLFYCSLEGVLFSKDMKTLIRYPGYKGCDVYKVPEGVEKIEVGAFSDSIINKLVLPSTIRNIEAKSFLNSVIDELLIKDGLEEIKEDIFIKSRILKIKLPKSLKKIHNYAFRKIEGLDSFSCESEVIEIGVGVFSEGTFKDVTWWCWSEIPKATFLNCTIENILIPNGVENICDYAFAGCYKAKKIVIPVTVQSIEMHSFDEGHSYNKPIFLPEHLYHFVYRFPAGSLINGKTKNIIWDQRILKKFAEDKTVLNQQIMAIQLKINELSFIQREEKRSLLEQIRKIKSLLTTS